jgi:hypothetical protein
VKQQLLESGRTLVAFAVSVVVLAPLVGGVSVLGLTFSLWYLFQQLVALLVLLFVIRASVGGRVSDWVVDGVALATSAAISMWMTYTIARGDGAEAASKSLEINAFTTVPVTVGAFIAIAVYRLIRARRERAC